jgi:hypothetical protein
VVLQVQVDISMGEKTEIGREMQDMEVRLEKERAGAGAREVFAWEREVLGAHIKAMPVKDEAVPRAE